MAITLALAVGAEIPVDPDDRRLLASAADAMSETMFFLLLVLPGFVAGFVVAAWFATTNWRSIGVFALGFGAAAFVGMAVDPKDDDDWGGLFEMFLIIGNLIGWTLGAGFGTAAAWTRVKRSS